MNADQTAGLILVLVVIASSLVDRLTIRGIGESVT